MFTPPPLVPYYSHLNRKSGGFNPGFRYYVPQITEPGALGEIRRSGLRPGVGTYWTRDENLWTNRSRHRRGSPDLHPRQVAVGPRDEEELGA